MTKRVSSRQLLALSLLLFSPQHQNAAHSYSLSQFYPESKKNKETAESSTTTTGSSTTTTNSAQILTRSSLSFLGETLDAGDVVECYTLTRMAKLKMPPLSNIGKKDEDEDENSDGSDTDSGYDELRYYDNSTSVPTPPPSKIPTSPPPIYILKSALAFRYRPPSWSGSFSEAGNDPETYSDEQDSSNLSNKPPFELTIEYGPQRTGADMENEAMPIVSGGDVEGGEGKFVTWQNEAKIYYETTIDRTRWDTANYMAPITGAVLSKILDSAVEYTIHHPRFQPFEVFDVFTKEVLIHSSSSDDFVWNSFKRLSDVYVNLKPILIPMRNKVRLYVNTNIENMDVESEGEEEEEGFIEEEEMFAAKRVEAFTSSVHAAEFIENFYACAYRVNNGEMEEIEEEEDDNDDDGHEHSADGGNATSSHADHNSSSTSLDFNSTSIPNEKEDEDKQDQNAESDNETNDELNEGKSSDGNNGKQQNDDKVDDSADDNNDENADDSDRNGNDYDHDGDDVDNDRLPSNSTLASPSSSLVEHESANNNSTNNGTNYTHSKKHKKKKHKETKNNSTTRRSLYESPLTDENGMYTLSSCFSPLMKDHISTIVYLFINGANYYKLNLTFPYIENIYLEQPLPEPDYLTAGRGDAIDWTLALIIIFGSVYGVYAILVQTGLIRRSNPRPICGGLFVSHNLDENSILLPTLDNSSDHNNGNNLFPVAQRTGQGAPHPWAEDAIPISMGGRQLGRSAIEMTHRDRRDKHDREATVTPYRDNESYRDNEACKDNDEDERPLQRSNHSGGVVSASSPLEDDLITLSSADEGDAEVGVVNTNSDNHFTRAGSAHTNNLGEVLSEGSVHSLSDDDLMRHIHPRSKKKSSDLVDVPTLKSTSKVALPVSVSYSEKPSRATKKTYNKSTLTSREDELTKTPRTRNTKLKAIIKTGDDNAQLSNAVIPDL